MSLWQIAGRNVWQNRGRYLSYLGSAAFSVMVFFLYMAFVLDPELQTGYPGADKIVPGMYAAAVVIAIFTLFFLLYSNAAFIRSRAKEFGLLSLMGMSRSELIAMILWEALIVAVVALAAGLGAGLLFLKLFFMAISLLLHLPSQLPFYAGLRVWGVTLGVFGSFFLVVSLASLGGVLRRNIIELIRAGRQPKTTPSFSVWQAALGVLLLGSGYWWATAHSRGGVVLGMLPITLIVSIGTYLLLREGSIAFLTWLRRRQRFFYRPGPFLTVSQLVFKMQDNYRVLSAVAIVLAVVLTALGSIVSAFGVTIANQVAGNHQAVQVVTASAADLPAAAAGVDAVLHQYGVTGLTEHQLSTATAKIGKDDGRAVLLPYSLYAANFQGASKVTLAPTGEGILIYTPVLAPGKTPPFDAHVTAGGETLWLHLLPVRAGGVLNDNAGEQWALVLPDNVWDQLMAQVPAASRVGIAFWSGKSWRQSAMVAALPELRRLYPAAEHSPLTTALEAYRGAVGSLGLVLFIGVFVSLVFFAASCSLLYFRLFTEIDEDRKYLRRLQQLGASTGELKRLARGQVLVLFLVPFALGVLHSTFAMAALGTLLQHTVLQYGWLVALAYLVLYAIYLAASATFYWRSLRLGLSARETA